MSIKQSIAALFLFFSVSFSAYSQEVYEWKFHSSNSYCGYDILYASASFASSFSCAHPSIGDYYDCRIEGSSSRKNFVCSLDDRGKTHAVSLAYLNSMDICPDGTELIDGICKEPPPETCEDLKAKDAPAPSFIPDDGQSLATTRYYCDTGSMCEAKQSYFAQAGDLVKENYYTGNECVGSAEDYTNDPYYPPVTGPTDPDPVDPDDPSHIPDDPTGEIFDPSPLPDSSNNTVTPDETEPEPEVEDPLTDPNVDPTSTDTGVVKAITGMNSDINSALNDLNIDINQNGADVQNQLVLLNDMVHQNSRTIQDQQKNDNRIYENTKALIQKANADITTSVNKNTNAVNALGDDLEAISEDVAGISETLDGIANTDTSGAGIGGTCIESGTCQGFYESGYPEGLGGLVSGQLNDLKTNTIDNFVNSFGELDLSNAQRPSFVLPVPFFGEFSFEEHISFDWVFGFIRAVLIMSSIFAARRIIFGG